MAENRGRSIYISDGPSSEVDRFSVSTRIGLHFIDCKALYNNCFNMNFKNSQCLDSGQNMGSIIVWHCAIAKIWHFPPPSAISACFQLKQLILKAILKSRVFPLSIFNKNASTLARMRGRSTSGHVLLPRFGIFLHFQPFQPVFS